MCLFCRFINAANRKVYFFAMFGSYRVILLYLDLFPYPENVINVIDSWIVDCLCIHGV